MLLLWEGARMIPQGWTPGMSLEDSERETIIAAFRFHRFNKTKTAAALGIAIRTLDYKIANYQKAGYLPKELPKEDRHEIQVPG